MNAVANKTSPKKWALVIVSHNVGCLLGRAYEIGPLLFPYRFQPPIFQRVLFVLAAYLLVQYVFVHFLVKDFNDLRLYHFKLLRINLCVAVSTVTTLPYLARDEIYASTGLIEYIFASEGVSVSILFISTLIAILRFKKHSKSTGGSKTRDGSLS